MLDERTQRIMAASEAIGLGYGAIYIIRRAYGLSRKAISKGILEIQKGESLSHGRIPYPGAGRKKITVTHPQLLAALGRLIEREPAAIPNLLCGGFAKAREPWPQN